MKLLVLMPLLALALALPSAAQTGDRSRIDASTLRGKVMCGYQGWFRCAGDPAGMGWPHWSRDARQVRPDSLTVDMWPDVSEYGDGQVYVVPGFTHPDGSQACLFSSADEATVRTHFRWMREYGIDGAWLQRFCVGLPGGPLPVWTASTALVLGHVRKAAAEMGRAWAISYDTAAMPPDQIYDVLTADWRALVDSGVTSDAQYMHEGGRPVIQVWGFYPGDKYNRISPETGHRLADFFATPGPYQAYFVGGGTWDWRSVEGEQWQSLYHRFDAYCPWNIGNYSLDEAGAKHASTGSWEAGRAECRAHGILWLPTVYPGFSWDNLTQQAPGKSLIARRGGMFLWEQFVQLARMGADTVYVAMFDEVDEGTAIFKVTSEPPVQGHFVGYEGLPSDWYLRLVGAGAEMLRRERPITDQIPLDPAESR